MTSIPGTSGSVRKREARSLASAASLVINGDRLGSVYGVRVIVQEAWNSALGLPDTPNYALVGHGRVGDEGCVMLWRDDMRLDAKLQDCVAWMERWHI